MPVAAILRQPRLGLRRRPALRAARRLWRSGRPEAPGRRGARARADGASSTSSTTISGRTGTISHLYAPRLLRCRRARRRGALRSTTTARRCAASSSRTRSTGSRSTASTACGSMPSTRSATDPTPHILEEIAAGCAHGSSDRHVHLTTEDDAQHHPPARARRRGRPRLYTAEWNDDCPPCRARARDRRAARATTRTTPTSRRPSWRARWPGLRLPGRAVAVPRRQPRGEPSAQLPPTAFVDFLQNHDQIGNRAFGERLTALAEPEAIELLTAILLLSPQIPLLFMGEEWGETRPFLFFTDFHGELAGRARGPAQRVPQMAAIQRPENCAPASPTRMRSRPSRDRASIGVRRSERRSAGAWRWCAGCSRCARREIVPRLAAVQGGAALVREVDGRVIRVTWNLGGERYGVVANLSSEARPLAARITEGLRNDDRLIFELPEGAARRLDAGELPAWSCAFSLATGQQR